AFNDHVRFADARRLGDGEADTRIAAQAANLRRTAAGEEPRTLAVPLEPDGDADGRAFGVQTAEDRDARLGEEGVALRIGHPRHQICSTSRPKPLSSRVTLPGRATLEAA